MNEDGKGVKVFGHSTNVTDGCLLMFGAFLLILPERLANWLAVLAVCKIVIVRVCVCVYKVGV